MNDTLCITSTCTQSTCYCSGYNEGSSVSKRCMNFSKSNHVASTQPSHCTVLDWNKSQSLPGQRCIFVSLDKIQCGSPQPVCITQRTTMSYCTASNYQHSGIVCVRDLWYRRSIFGSTFIFDLQLGLAVGNHP